MMASAMTMPRMEVTTAEVAALPTAAASWPQRMPRRQPATAMMIAEHRGLEDAAGKILDTDHLAHLLGVLQRVDAEDG